jgi:hypothetical protein
MRTVFVGPVPPGLLDEIERRHAIGADLYDEMWNGERHLAPAPNSAHGRIDSDLAVILWPLAQKAGLVMTSPFNLGRPENYRVPDRGLLRAPLDATWVPTAALVAEVVYPEDESWQKLDFYAAHHVDEVVIVDPAAQSVTWLRRNAEGYQPTDHSELLDALVADVASQISWT